MAGLMVATVPSADGTDDQHRIVEALADSSTRMLEAGLWSAGPGTRDAEFVSGCLGGLDVPGRLPPLPGETARGFSDVYLFRPDATSGAGELLTVAVVAVGEADQPAIEELVLLLGDPATARCRRQELLDGADADTNGGGATPTVEVRTTDDLGVADASARLDLGIVFAGEGAEHRVAYSYLAARAGRMFVLVRLVTFGEGGRSGVDVAVELAAVVDSLDP